MEKDCSKSPARRAVERVDASARAPSLHGMMRAGDEGLAAWRERPHGGDDSRGEKVYITPLTIGVGTLHPPNYKTGCLTP